MILIFRFRFRLNVGACLLADRLQLLQHDSSLFVCHRFDAFACHSTSFAVAVQVADLNNNIESTFYQNSSICLSNNPVKASTGAGACAANTFPEYSGAYILAQGPNAAFVPASVSLPVLFSLLVAVFLWM